jgi:DNA-directed RNA polymerase I subunit RPA12
MSAAAAAPTGAAATSPILIWDPKSPFCPCCGSMLLLPAAGDVACDGCPFTQPMDGLAAAFSETRSFPRPAPEWLVEWRVMQAARRGDIAREDVAAAVLAAGGKAKAKRALVDEECPKCKNPQMEYYTVQQRSADEGETVYFVCPKCEHSFSVNN